MEMNSLLELQRMSRLLALTAVKGLEVRESIRLLVNAGYSAVEIGSLLGVTSNSVHMILKRERKKSTSKGKKKTTFRRRPRKGR